MLDELSGFASATRTGLQHEWQRQLLRQCVCRKLLPHPSRSTTTVTAVIAPTATSARQCLRPDKPLNFVSVVTGQDHLDRIKEIGMIKTETIRRAVKHCLFVCMALFGLSVPAIAKTGTVSITAPSNGITVPGNFNVSVKAPLWWTNGILNDGIYNTYSVSSCVYTSLNVWQDYYFNGSKNVVGRLYYSVDGQTPVAVQDINSDSGETFTIPINASSLPAGNHFVTVSTRTVYSTMAPYYGQYSGSCLTNCTASGCHSNAGVWQRHDGSTVASAMLTFVRSVPTEPNILSPANRFFTGSVTATNVNFSWDYLFNATSYNIKIYEHDSFRLVQEGTPSTNSFATSSLLPLRRYGWNVAGVNSAGTGPYAKMRNFIIGPSMECFPEIGDYGSFRMIPTCYDLTSSTDSYQLKDISRRATMDIDGHKGKMSDTASISTEMYNTSVPMTSPENIWSFGQKSGVDAHVNAGKVYDYILSKLKRSSPDGKDGSMVSIVESTDGRGCPNNAFFDPARSIPTVQYCAGTTFSSSVDIVGHEWGHAITKLALPSRGTLTYSGESGALNEAFSDWIGIAIKQQNGDNSWLITAGSTTRSLSDPLASVNPQQPDTYGSGPWYDINNCKVSDQSTDYCGVHYNSGVPNKMFFLLAHPGTNVHRNITTVGLGMDKAISIAYKANVEKWVNSNLTFRDAREGMISAARDLFGYGSFEALQVENAWNAVGVTSTSTPSSLIIKKIISILTNLSLQE